MKGFESYIFGWTTSSCLMSLSGPCSSGILSLNVYLLFICLCTSVYVHICVYNVCWGVYTHSNGTAHVWRLKKLQDVSSHLFYEIASIKSRSPGLYGNSISC